MTLLVTQYNPSNSDQRILRIVSLVFNVRRALNLLNILLGFLTSLTFFSSQGNIFSSRDDYLWLWFVLRNIPWAIFMWNIALCNLIMICLLLFMAVCGLFGPYREANVIKVSIGGNFLNKNENWTWRIIFVWFKGTKL